MEGGEGPPKTPTSELHFSTSGRPPRPPMTAEMMQQAQLQMLSQWRTRGPPMPTMSRAPMPHYRPASPMGSPVMRPPMTRPLMNMNGRLPLNVRPPLSERPTTPRATPPKVTGLPIFKYFTTVPPYAVEMNETQFVESLSRFMGLINLPLRKVPRFKDQPIQMHSLYRTVTAFGGFHRVTDGNRWNAVAVSLQFSPITPELLVQLRSFYFTLFFAYEQVFFHRIPLDKVACMSSLVINSLGPHALIAQVQNLAPGTSEESRDFEKGFDTKGGIESRSLDSQSLEAGGLGLRGLESRNPDSRDLGSQVLGSRGLGSQSIESTELRGGNAQYPELQSSGSLYTKSQHLGLQSLETINMGMVGTENLLKSPEPIGTSSPIVPTKRPVPMTRTAEDDVKDMFRGGRLMLRKLSCTPTMGKISYEELLLMLDSDLTAVQNAGLGILERLSFDPNSALNTPSVVPLIRLLANLLSAEVRIKMADSVSGTKADNPPGTCTNLDQERPLLGLLGQKELLSDFSNQKRPFVYLRRKAEEEELGLLSRPKPKSSRIESIVNIIRNWSVRADIPSIIAGEEHFVWKVLVPILTKKEVWSTLSLECYSGLWMVFVQISSLITLTEGTQVEALLTLAMDEVAYCLQDYRAHAVNMSPELYLSASSTAAVKNAIIQFIKVANATWKTIPPHCFLLMDALCRLLSNLRDGGIFDGECEQKKSMATVLVRIVETMWGFVESFVLAALGVAYLIDVLLRSGGEFYKSYTESVPHNVHFGLPDGGYLELSLLTLLHALRRLDARHYSDWSVEMERLIRWCDSLRRLWLHPPVGNQSPLLTQPVNAVTSQPYLVLIRMYAILGHLAMTMPLRLGTTEVTAVIGWITEMPTGVVGELLGRPEFVNVAETILASIQLQ